MNSPASAPNHQAALWDAMLDAHLNVCYWSSLVRRYTRLDNAFKMVIAIAASGTVAAWSFWASHQTYWKAFSAFACLAAITHPFICSTEKLKHMASLIGAWKELLAEYDLLWVQDHNLSETRNWKQFELARNKEAKIDETRLPYSERLRWKAAAEVRRIRGLHRDGR